MGIKRFFRNLMHQSLNTRTQLNELQNKLNQIQNDIEILKTQSLINSLHEKTLCSHESGISTEQYCEHKIIVSLTTFNTRIDKVYLPIESIMQGTIKPNRIILWLSEEEYKDAQLPQTLKLQQKRGLEVRLCKDFLSYNKLIHTIAQYPEAAIITIDDDVLYEYDIIERLVNAHKHNPRSICACRMHRINIDKDGNILPYMNWQHCINDEVESNLNFPTGEGGILYPPHCFNNEVLNHDVFLKICPKADDIWFYVMARINGTSNVHVKTPRPDGYYHSLPIYPNSLSYYNTHPKLGGNDFQLNNVIKKYNFKI